MSRRLRQILLGAALFAASFAAPPATAAAARVAGAAEAERGPLVGAVGPITITVSDLDRSIDFFTRVLTFEKLSEAELAGEAVERLQGVFGARLRVARLRLGDEEVELQEYLAPRGRPVPADSRSNDLWFQHVAIIVGDMERAYRRLREHRVEHASSGPQRLPDWNRAAGGIEAFYFRDPDGHPLEILRFPPGKGDPKWRRSTDRLFLGIDHTAIVVADTERSLAFYRDRLGMRVAGESENYGPEQERLNNVFGARVRITALRAAAGPGIELLQYLSPGGGRPRPEDARPNDLIHWQARLVCADAAAAERAARAAGAVLWSPGWVRLPGRELGFGGGLTLADPDGHALQLVADVETGRR
jgi:catechol 2,3-dioxygenase-like lactoylglutathione lyase family enzyme